MDVASLVTSFNQSECIISSNTLGTPHFYMILCPGPVNFVNFTLRNFLILVENLELPIRLITNYRSIKFTIKILIGLGPALQ